MVEHRRQGRVRRRAAAALAVGLGLVLAAGQAQAQQSERDLLKRAGGSRAKGLDGAPVLVFEIADFQCPFCARFAQEVYPRLDSAFVRTGKVQWVFVNLPLPNHARAWGAAEAAMCAGGVGDRFWPMHDRLFAGQAEWSTAADPAAVYLRYARELGLPMNEFAACLTRDLMAPLLIEDLLFASATGASGTPAFVINQEELVVGMKGYDEWAALLEKAIAKKKQD